MERSVTTVCDAGTFYPHQFKSEAGHKAETILEVQIKTEGRRKSVNMYPEFNGKPRAEFEEYLILNNMGLVKSLANKYKKASRRVSYEELEAEGNLSLCKCAHSYNEESGVKFSSYAYKCIELGMIDFVHNNMTVLSVPERDLRKMNNKLLEQKSKGEEANAMDSIIVASTDDEGMTEVVDSNNVFEASDRMMENGWFTQELQLELTPDEYALLDYRYGLRDGIPHTLEDTAFKFLITSKSASNLEKKALKKIRNNRTLLVRLAETYGVGDWLLRRS